MRDLVFVALFLAMLPMAIRFGHIGTMLWAWIAMVAPGLYMFGFAAGLPFNKIVVAVAVLALLVDRQNRPPFYFDTHLKLLVAFLVVALTSYMMALSDRPRVDDLADRLTKTVALCMFMVATVRSRLHIHSLLIAVSMGMGIHGAIEALKYVVTGGGHILIGPQTIGDNNHFGLAILMVLPPLAYLYRYSDALLIRIAFALALLANTIGVIASNSRGALLGLIAMGAYAFLKSRNKLTMIMVLLVLGGIGLAVAPDRWYERMGTISEAREDGSFMGRVAMWKMNTIVALDRPLVGGGFSSMEDPAVFNRYLPQSTSLDWLFTSVTPATVLAAHSIYFQVLGDTGFIGLALFLGLLLMGYRNSQVILRLTKDRPDLQWARDAGLFLRFSLIAYTVSGAALSLAYFEFYYLIITLISITRKHVEGEVTALMPSAFQRLLSPSRATFPGAKVPARSALPQGTGRG
jgi:probable O-glycosylation ligase (exosortase A-associated)